MRKYLIIAVIIFAGIFPAKISAQNIPCKIFAENITAQQFIASAELLDAVISSIQSLGSLVKKENYRNKIASFNNPASSDLGFSLENELQEALRPLLAKAQKTNANKFASIAGFLVSNPLKVQLSNPVFAPTGIFNSLLGLVGSLAIKERKITRQDLDSFSISMAKYFVQYEKLDRANKQFSTDMDRLSDRLQELQFDTHEFMLDVVSILYKDSARSQLKTRNLEELMLRFLDKKAIVKRCSVSTIRCPGDGIKTAKEIVYGIQKSFEEYQHIYEANYREISNVLSQSKGLSKNVNISQVESSAKILSELYQQSKDADVLNIRMTTLLERLRVLCATEQLE